MTEAIVRPQDTTQVLYRTADEIREFCEEFPSKKARIEELLRAKTGKRIVLTDEHKEIVLCQK